MNGNNGSTKNFQDCQIFLEMQFGEMKSNLNKQQLFWSIFNIIRWETIRKYNKVIEYYPEWVTLVKRGKTYVQYTLGIYVIINFECDR